MSMWHWGHTTIVSQFQALDRQVKGTDQKGVWQLLFCDKSSICLGTVGAKPEDREGCIGDWDIVVAKETCLGCTYSHKR